MMDTMESSMEFCDTKKTISLLDLTWEDILFEKILPLLTWKDLFHLRSVSLKALRMVTSYFSNIKEIDLSPALYNSFSSVAFRTATERCTNLRTVIINDSSWINDQILISIFNQNRFLTHLDLSCCTNLDGSCLLSLVTNCKLLKVLRLRECPWVNTSSIETLTGQMRMLEQVDFTSCGALRNIEITQFTEAFPKLTALHLANCQFVTDSTLSIIARNCQNITLLDIRACKRVTDNGIRFISEYCNKLKTLYISNCQLVTEYSLKVFRDREKMTIDRQCAVLVPIPRLQV